MADDFFIPNPPLAQGVLECLKAIKLLKAAGLGGLAAEHFAFSHTYFLCSFIVNIC